MVAQIFSPPEKVHFGSPIHMERSRQSLHEKFMVHQSDPLHRMEVRPSRRVGEQAVVGHRGKCDANFTQMPNETSTLFLPKRPPCLKRPVAVRPGQNYRAAV